MRLEVMDEEIGDTGEFVLFARKHMAESTGRRTQGDIRLSELWPEPGWSARIAVGLDIQVTARLAMLYDGFPKVRYGLVLQKIIVL